MSQEVNLVLFERAARQVDVWVGTLIADTLEKNLTDNDLDALLLNVQRAEKLEEEDEGTLEPIGFGDPMTPERAEAMYTEAESKRDALREAGDEY